MLLQALALGAPLLSGATQRPLPLIPVETSPERILLLPLPAEIEQLRQLEDLRLTDVPLPGQGLVSLTMVRAHVPASASNLWIDGAPAGSLSDLPLSLWSGEVAGQPGSDAWLAFSQAGCWGWIQTDSGLVHLRTQPGTNRVELIREEALEDSARAPFECSTEPIPLAAPVGNFAQGPASGPPLPLLRAKLGLETDWHFFQAFAGDKPAMLTYLASLLGAMDSRFREQFGVVLVPVYVGIHTDPDDGWESMDDFKTSASIVNQEFTSKWGNGQAPIDAHVFHLLSGAQPRGGHAPVGGLCKPSRFGTTLSANGKSTFPAAPGNHMHDFVILAHELGHSFGSIHTHEFCPPIDQCTSFNFGPCQDRQVCTKEGTNMSYCGMCPGVFANFTTWFHPLVADMIRANAESSCLPVFEGVLTSNLGFSHGLEAPLLEVDYGLANNVLRWKITRAPASTTGLVVVSLDRNPAPFRGGVLVPGLDLLLPISVGAQGSGKIIRTVEASFPLGTTLYTQAWFPHPASAGGATASAALAVELIRP